MPNRVPDSQQTEQIATLQRDLHEEKHRLDRHLEIYANNGRELAGLKIEVKGLTHAINILNEKLEENFVTKAEFLPTNRIAYGLVAIVLIGVFGQWLSLLWGERQSAISKEALHAGVEAAVSN